MANDTIQENKLELRCSNLKDNKTFENLYRLIFDHGDTIASVYEENGETIQKTYSEYNFLSTRYAVHIQNEVGIENKGKYIALALDTCPAWNPLFWGIIKAGYNVLLLDFNLSNSMTLYMMQQAGAVAIIHNNIRALDASLKQLKVIDVINSNVNTAGFKADFANQVALCTSGTTGSSRIFVYNGQAIAEQVLSSMIIHKKCPRIIPESGMRVLAFLPNHHIFGFITDVLWCSFLGYTLVYPNNRTPDELISICNKYDVELIIAVPLLANNLCVSLEKKLKNVSSFHRSMFRIYKGVSLFFQSISPNFGMWIGEKVLFPAVLNKMLGTEIKAIILGGSHTPKEHIRTLCALGYYTTCGFGMTETAITSVETNLHLLTRVSGSVGRPLNNVEYRIKPDTKKKNRGEMQIAGKSIHIGRLIDGEFVSADLEEDKWFSTGDLVRLERGNRMYIEGRCKDVIIGASGENVYPDEIEDYFSELQDVEQFSVLGIKKSKHKQYEDTALIVNIGAAYTDNEFIANLADKIQAINVKLPVVKRLGRVIITPEKLPLVNGIKVKRLELKQNIEHQKVAYRDLLLKNKQFEEVAKPEASISVKPSDLEMDEIRLKVKKVYAEALEIPADTIKNDDHFIDDLGGDSLRILSIALKIEDLFSVTIPVEEYGQCATVNNLSSLLYGKIRGNVAYEKEGDKSPEDEIVPIRKFTDSPEYLVFKKRQESLMTDNASNPYFVCHESALLDKSNMDGHEVLNFGSYNYVGMSGRKEVKEAAKRAIDYYGTSASGSRLLAGEKKLNIELEKELAEFKHSEAALVLVGGHSTNVTFIGNFCGKDDLILYDALAHNSIEQGCMLSAATAKPFPHNDVEALERILKTRREKYAKVLIAIEGAYSMDGDIADVPAFIALKKKYGCFLLVDEAHSTCVIGETGRGVDEYFGLNPDDIDIKMGTLSKGFGTCGGYLCGSKELINYLRYNLPGFVFSVGISPALAGATLESIRQMRKDKSIMEHMRRNIKAFMSEAKRLNLNTCLAGETAILPVLVGTDEDAFLLSNKMRENGVFVPPAVYPAVPKNKARLRFCVVSEHTPEQITTALETLIQVAAECNIALPASAK